jgi:hypothetical protein
MRFLDSLCPPAFLYAIFLAINLGFDVSDLALVTATFKVIFGGISIFVLNYLCRLDLGIVSWFLVALPFVMTALATSVAMGMDLDRQIMKQLTKA